MKFFRLIIGCILVWFGSIAFAYESEKTCNDLLDLANDFININSDSVIYYADSAYLLSGEKNHDSKIQALFLIISTQIKQGKISSAILNCKVADSIIEIEDLPQYKAKILMYFGLVYNNSGLNSEGIQYLHQAIEIDEKMGSSELRDDLDYYLALAYYLAGDNKKCQTLCYATIQREINQSDSLSAIDNCLLLVNTFQDIDSVGKYLLQVKFLLPNSKASYKRVTYLNNSALLQKALGNYDNAKESYIEAINISIKNSFQKYLTNLYNNYAYLMMAEDNNDSAYFYLNEAMVIVKRVDDIYLEAKILDSFSDYYAKVDDSIKSFIAYKASVKLKNEYREKQQIEKARFLSTVFETERKEQQIIKQKSDLSRAKYTILLVLFILVALMVVLMYIRQIAINRKTKIKYLEREKRVEVVNALVKGQDEERRRLAMDLHDGILPRMGALKMNIETSFTKNQTREKTILLLDDINKEIRAVSHKLLPSQLESKGLVFALRNFISLTEQSSIIIFDFYNNLNGRLPPNLEVNLFYLAYELINNAIKHSKASIINIELLNNKGILTLNVSDDGIGFDTSLVKTGLGLQNIKQRVDFINGNLIIDSVNNQGTYIIVEVEYAN